MQRNLVPKHKGLKITLTLDTYEQKVWMMRQPTTLNAEDQQARNSNQRRRQSEAMSRALRVIKNTLVSLMLTQTAQKPKFLQYKGQSSEVLPGHSGWLHQAREDW